MKKRVYHVLFLCAVCFTETSYSVSRFSQEQLEKMDQEIKGRMQSQEAEPESEFLDLDEEIAAVEKKIHVLYKELVELCHDFSMEKHTEKIKKKQNYINGTFNIIKKPANEDKVFLSKKYAENIMLFLRNAKCENPSKASPYKQAKALIDVDLLIGDKKKAGLTFPDTATSDIKIRFLENNRDKRLKTLSDAERVWFQSIHDEFEKDRAELLKDLKESYIPFKYSKRIRRGAEKNEKIRDVEGKIEELTEDMESLKLQKRKKDKLALTKQGKEEEKGE